MRSKVGQPQRRCRAIELFGPLSRLQRGYAEAPCSSGTRFMAQDVAPFWPLTDAGAG
jgi:hypothetical protein